MKNIAELRESNSPDSVIVRERASVKVIRILKPEVREVVISGCEEPAE